MTSWHANKFCFRTSIQRVLKKKFKKRLKIQIKCVFNWKWFWKICHCFISLHTIDEGFLTIKLHFKAGMGGKDGVGNKSVDILTVVPQWTGVQYTSSCAGYYMTVRLFHAVLLSSDSVIQMKSTYRLWRFPFDSDTIQRYVLPTSHIDHACCFGPPLGPPLK